MNSKIDRLESSIENVKEAIKYYLKDLENKNISKSEYNKISRNLNDLNLILKSLEVQTSYKDDTIDEIRRINLSIKSMYEEGDYEIVFGEIFKTHNILCQDLKEKDKKRLMNLKTIFNNLSNFYKYRLSKAQMNSKDSITFNDKRDNVKFIIENYLNIKYNFKKIKYEDAKINDINQSEIDEWIRIININKENEDIKKISFTVIEYITKYSEAATVIDNLKKIDEICDKDIYLSIQNVVDKLINKYQIIYDNNRKEYKNILELSKVKLDIEQNNINSKTK